jgi:environmental stress-induced protein Ves
MNALHRIALADCPSQAWRNGGGVTRELAAWPHARDWSLRVSVATIERDSPFSAFPGAQRWFVVLAGAGVRLALAHGEVALTPAHEPIGFDGAEAPACHLLGGPTLDLNFMVGRACGAACLRRAALGSALDGDLRWRALYAADEAELDVDGSSVSVAPDTLVWCDERNAGRWTLLQGRRAFWLTLEGA